MICSYFRIAFLLFFMNIGIAVYTSCQNSTLLFINGLIFYIMNTQNNQSLEFEFKWKPMLVPLRSVNDRRFSWLPNVFLKSFQDWMNSVQLSNAKETLQKMLAKRWLQKVFISWQTFEGLKISLHSITEVIQFLLWHQVNYVLRGSFCQDPL